MHVFVEKNKSNFMSVGYALFLKKLASMLFKSRNKLTKSKKF